MKKTYNVFIVGTTAVGKTKLSLILAEHLKGQIIGCDSMQLYKNADIMTAKANKQEQSTIRHHMIDMVELNQLGFNRNKYRDISQPIFDRLHGEGKSPIVVGGTNYYIQTLLFQNDSGIAEPSQAEDPGKMAALQKKSLEMDITEKYNLLREIDPSLADKLHRNDHQRISNYLNKYFRTLRKPSETYMLPTYRLRNANTVLFWIRNSNKDELRELIRSRVDKMVDINGIVQIVSIFLFIRDSSDNQGGVLQSIGYKQFRPFFEALDLKIPAGLTTTYSQTYQWVRDNLTGADIEKHQVLLDECKQDLTLSSVKYAKRQVTWIRNRLFGSNSISHNFFILDIDGQGDLMERFDGQVKDRAIHILQTIDNEGFGSVKGGLPEAEVVGIQEYSQVKKLGQWKKYECQICHKQVNGKLEYDQHVRSSLHKKTLKFHNKLKQQANNPCKP